MRKSYLETSQEFGHGRFESLILELQEVNKLEIKETASASCYYLNDMGAIFVLKVLESGFKDYASKVVQW